MGVSNILPHLFLGGLRDVRSQDWLASEGITHILNVGDTGRSIDGGLVQYLHVPISDYGETELAPVLEKCFAFINAGRDSGGKVLLHCRHGSNRSPTVLVGYLMVELKYPLKQAHTHVVSRREQIGVHENYLKQLQDLEFRLFGSISLTQADLGISVQEFIRNLRDGER